MFQYWIKKDGSPGFVSIQESPVVTGLFGSSFETVNGQTIQRSVVPAVPGRNFQLVSLYWQNKGVAYIVTVSILGEINEQVGRDVLMSLQ